MRVRTFFAGLAAAVLAATGATAGDLVRMQPAPTYNPAAFSFEGFYLGAQGGGAFGNYHVGSLGVVAGANFDVGNSIVAGGEFQGDWLFGDSLSPSYDFYALGRVGMIVSPDLLAYAEAGPGWTSQSSVYAFGGGAEYAITDSLGLKGEVLGTGEWGSGRPDLSSPMICGAPERPDLLPMQRSPQGSFGSPFFVCRSPSAASVLLKADLQHHIFFSLKPSWGRAKP
jgi:outer membrane immunogenic protein